MKKPTTQKKLALRKETLTDLEQVSGGSQINNTVYYPPPTYTKFPNNNTNQNA